jgi:hypothetical protein
MLGHSIVSQHFMEPKGSIPNSQQLSTCSYPEPDQSSPHHPIPPLQDPTLPHIKDFTSCRMWGSQSSWMQPRVARWVNRRFGGTRHIQLQSRRPCFQHSFTYFWPSSSSCLQIETMCSSETSADFQLTTRSHISQDRIVRRICCVIYVVLLCFVLHCVEFRGISQLRHTECCRSAQNLSHCLAFCCRTRLQLSEPYWYEKFPGQEMFSVDCCEVGLLRGNKLYKGSCVRRSLLHQRAALPTGA